jgi:hypothetical protein
MRRLPLLIVFLLLLAVPAGATAVTTRIVGGNAAVAANWTSTVALETSYGSQFCGGSLVAPQWVLTAGHCKLYPNSQLRVVTGTTSLIDGSGQTLPVARQVRHPSYRQTVPGAPRDDLMLVRLGSPSAAPVMPLATGSRPPAAGTTLHVAGWGSTSYNAANDSFGVGSSTLQTVAVRVRASTFCVDAYGAKAFFPQDMICASLPGRDACAGDSGGPLVDRPGPDARLVGVVSWGTGCALARFPGVYSLVAHNHCWIASTVNPPGAPRTAAVAQADGTLSVDWEWPRPCADAPLPSAYRIRVVETGQVIEVPGAARRADVGGLVNGATYTLAVSAVNENGESPPLTVTGVPGPNFVAAQQAVWTGYRTAKLTFTLAPHGAPLQWRVESGTGLRFTPGPWQSAPPSEVPAAIVALVDGLPVGAAADLRVVVTDGVVTTSTQRTQLPTPEPPATVGGVHIVGVASVGATVRCDLGRWTGTRPFAITRQWLADGRPLPAATERLLRIPPALDGRALS